MEKQTVTISKEEYSMLMSLVGRVNAFKGIVKASEYAIDRQICANVFGFELEEKVKE